VDISRFLIARGAYSGFGPTGGLSIDSSSPFFDSRQTLLNFRLKRYRPFCFISGTSGQQEDGLLRATFR